MLYRVRHLTFFFQLGLISWMVTLSSCLIWQVISFILPPNELGYVYAWTTLGNGLVIDLQKKLIFAFSSRWVCKQAKLSHLGHRKPSSIHWKADAPKTRHEFWSRGIIRLFFFENEQREAVTVNGDRYRAMFNEFLIT